jgi:hypothetical protein
VRKNTNIQFKRAEHDIWLKKYADYVPLRGEPCIAYNVGEHKDTQIKIGDGVSTFAELEFLGKNNAIDIRYDNEKSGLKATNVQDALDELQTVLIREDVPTEDTYADLGDFWFDKTEKRIFQLVSIIDDKYTWKELAYTDTLVKEAEAAKKLSEARTITISNDADGSVEFDGTKDVDIAITLKDLDSNRVIDIDEKGENDEKVTLQTSLQKIKSDIANEIIARQDAIEQEAKAREDEDKKLSNKIETAIHDIMSSEVTFKGIVDDETQLPTENNTNGDMYWIRAFSKNPPAGMHEGRSGSAIYVNNSGFQFTEDAIYQPDNKTIHLNNLQLEVIISEEEANALSVRDTGLYVDVSALATKATTINGYALDQDITLTTSDIAEGTNLYYTEERVQNVVRDMSSEDLTDTENILYNDDVLILNCGGAS